jgi:N-methylhydantoinase B
MHRGGNGIEKRYVYLEPGEVSIHDDRWLTYPWGILGGKPGTRSEKLLVRKDGSQERLPSKCDEVQVEPGDMLVYRTAGGGGWKDPFDRPVEKIEADVAKGLVSAEKARADYGVVVGDADATEKLRERLRAERGDVVDFDMGPPLEEIVARAKDETGLVPPVPPEPLAWAPMESSEDALRRVREHGDRQMTQTE